MFRLSDLIPFDPNFPIWRIDEADLSSMMLYKCSDELYRTIQQGKLATVFVSQLFIIINNELLQFLVEHVSEQFQHHPVTIYDRPTDSNIIGYHRLCPNTTASYEEILGVHYSGKKIWIGDGSEIIFISLDLKNALSQSGIEGIDCVPGLVGMG